MTINPEEIRALVSRLGMSHKPVSFKAPKPKHTGRYPSQLKPQDHAYKAELRRRLKAEKRGQPTDQFPPRVRKKGGGRKPRGLTK